MYSVDFSPDLVQIQKQETVSEVFWHKGTSHSKSGIGGNGSKELQRSSNYRKRIWVNANDGISV